MQGSPSATQARTLRHTSGAGNQETSIGNQKKGTGSQRIAPGTNDSIGEHKRAPGEPKNCAGIPHMERIPSRMPWKSYARGPGKSTAPSFSPDPAEARESSHNCLPGHEQGKGKFDLKTYCMHRSTMPCLDDRDW